MIGRALYEFRSFAAAVAFGALVLGPTQASGELRLDAQQVSEDEVAIVLRSDRLTPFQLFSSTNLMNWRSVTNGTASSSQDATIRVPARERAEFFRAVTIVGTNASPANDAFADVESLQGADVSWTADLAGATAEVGEPNHTGYGARHSAWWQWTAPSNGFVTINIADPVPGEGVAVYALTSESNLVKVAQTAIDLQRPALFMATAGENYRLAVDSQDPLRPLSLKLETGSEPILRLATIGRDTAIFGPDPSTVPVEVHATNGTPDPLAVTIAWHVSGFQTNSLTLYEPPYSFPIPGVNRFQLHRLTAAAHTRVGRISDSGAVYMVSERAGVPPNDDFVNRSEVQTGVPVNFFLDRSTIEGLEPTPLGSMMSISPSSRSVWHKWTAPFDGLFFLESLRSPFDQGLFRGTNLISLHFHDDNRSGFSARAGEEFAILTRTVAHISGFMIGSGAAPQATWLSPQENQVFRVGDPVVAEIAITNPEGSEHEVRYALGGVFLGESASPPYRLVFTPSAGTHQLSAMVTTPPRRGYLDLPANHGSSSHSKQ